MAHVTESKKMCSSRLLHHGKGHRCSNRLTVPAMEKADVSETRRAFLLAITCQRPAVPLKKRESMDQTIQSCKVAEIQRRFALIYGG